MDYDKEIETLKAQMVELFAEKLALQTVLVETLRHLIKEGGVPADVIKKAFDDSADDMIIGAGRYLGEPRTGHFAVAGSLVEQLRKIVFPAPEMPKHGV